MYQSQDQDSKGASQPPTATESSSLLIEDWWAAADDQNPGRTALGTQSQSGVNEDEEVVARRPEARTTGSARNDYGTLNSSSSEVREEQEVQESLSRSNRRLWRSNFKTGAKKMGRGSLRFFRHNEGLLLIALSEIFYPAMTALAKLLMSSSNVPTWEIIFIRMLVTFFVVTLWMLWMKIPNPVFGPKEVRKYLMFRGVGGFFGVFGLYYSVQYLALSDAIVLTFLSPVLTGLVAPLVLPETFSSTAVFSGLLSLIGVLLIAKPASLFGDCFAPDTGEGENESGDATARQRMGAVGVAMIGVMGAACAFISIRTIGNRATAMHMMSYFCMFAMVGSVGMAIIQRQPPVMPGRLLDLGLVVCIGVLGFIAQFLMSLGFQRETAGRGSIGIYTNIIWATILERIIFHSYPDVLSALGIIIIILGSLNVALETKTYKATSNKSMDEEVATEE